MEVKNDTRGGFDAAAIAMLTASEPRRQGFYPVPVRMPSSPALMTDQLRGCSCSTPAGLGFVDINQGTNEGQLSVLGTIAMGANYVPVVGPIASGVLNVFTQAINFFRNWLGIGAGRMEADAIVPTQNNLVARLGQITDNIRVGQTPTAYQLEGFYRELWQLGTAFMEFVLLPDFTDRRASGQALNTVMPYINGTCGYAVPLGMSISSSTLQFNCLSWGDGTIGGPGTDGMMGAVRRAIVARGGTVPQLPDMITAANSGFNVSTVNPPPGGGGILTAGFSTPLAVALGIGALYFFRKRGGF